MEDLIYRLGKRAEIRRQITTRKSVQEGKPDRIADLLEEAKQELQTLRLLLSRVPLDACCDCGNSEHKPTCLYLAIKAYR